MAALATERLLYRLSRSEYASIFVLKGARFFALWSHKLHQPTRYLDLLGFDDPSLEALRQVFESICRVQVESDGLIFDDTAMTIEEIKPSQEYDGQRIELATRLAQARIPLQIDVGFGDVVTPEAQMLDYIPLLDTLPAPRIRAYTRETVIVEKLQAIVALDTLNKRMKEFYDICTLANDFDFDGQTICEAILATFHWRKTPVLLELPSCLQDYFAKDEVRKRLWNGFLKRSAIEESASEYFSVLLAKVRDFLRPPLLAAAHHKADFPSAWRAGNCWRTRGSSG